MGYHTDFQGEFTINKPLDEETYNLLKGLQETRRMKRDVDEKFGVDGEFFVTDETTGVVDNNTPPATQPGLWCQWEIQDDRQTIQWDEGEKFYEYIPWIKYIIGRILAPRGYVLNGSVAWRGDEFDDTGVIEVVDNVVDGIELPTSQDVIALLEENKKAKEAIAKQKAAEKKAEEAKQLIKDGILERMMAATNFKGTLKEYKEMLENLVN